MSLSTTTSTTTTTPHFLSFSLSVSQVQNLSRTGLSCVQFFFFFSFLSFIIEQLYQGMQVHIQRCLPFVLSPGQLIIYLRRWGFTRMHAASKVIFILLYSTIYFQQYTYYIGRYPYLVGIVAFYELIGTLTVVLVPDKPIKWVDKMYTRCYYHMFQFLFGANSVSRQS